MSNELLEKIKLKETDMLYILGDILDQGPYPIKVLLKIMEMSNAVCLVGNHELMALDCLKFLLKEISDMSIEELDEQMVDNLNEIQYFNDVYLVTGHTSTQNIIGNRKPGYIYRANNHIAIDCGSCFTGGRLAAICLDTGKEFYSSENTK